MANIKKKTHNLLTVPYQILCF